MIPRLLTVGVCLAVLAQASTAQADMYTYTFESIMTHNVNDVLIAQRQLSVDVMDLPSGQVQFTFWNIGPDVCAIAGVYFDDGSLLGVPYLIDSDDSLPGGPLGHALVDFTADDSVSPPDLPEGDSATPPFKTTAGFLADADPPQIDNGVNRGEWLGVVFDLQVGRSFTDVIQELSDGTLRIGVRAHEFVSGGAESLVNSPVPIPAPGGAVLALIGLGMAGWVTRRYM